MANPDENDFKLSISSKENTMHFLVNYLVSDMCPPMLIYWEGMISAHEDQISYSGVGDTILLVT